MIATDFKTNYSLYENMELWEIASLEDFIKGDVLLPEIFEKEFGFPFDARHRPENKFSATLAEVVTRTLDHFGDKHFFVFSNGSAEHQLLKELQDKKIIHFGIDIHVIHFSKVYALIMDKSKDPAKYDTI